MSENEATAEWRGANEVFRLRKSRRSRACDYSRDTSWFRFCRDIQRGQMYVHVTVYPGHDFISTDRPQTGACCLACAAGYTGMDTLVPPATPTPPPTGPLVEPVVVAEAGGRS